MKVERQKPIQIDPTKFQALVLAITRRQLLVLQQKEQLQKALDAEREATIAAGLDPKKSYRLDEATCTATIIDHNP